jgi:GxxExxY protein
LALNSHEGTLNNTKSKKRKMGSLKAGEVANLIIKKPLLYKQEVFSIVGAAMAVHKELGAGFLESVYKEAMCIELNAAGVPYQTQVPVKVKYKNIVLQKEFIADLIAYNKIIIELKCVPSLKKTDEAQILNYLKATGFRVGLIINFGKQGKLEWKRYIF